MERHSAGLLITGTRHKAGHRRILAQTQGRTSKAALVLPPSPPTLSPPPIPCFFPRLPASCRQDIQCTGQCHHIHSLWLQSTTHPRPGSFNNRNVLSHASGAQKVKVKVRTGSVPPERCEGASIPGLSSSFTPAAGHLWCHLACTHVALVSAIIFSWCFPCGCVLVQLPRFYKDTGQTRSGPTLMTSSKLIIASRTLFPNKVTL